MSRSLLYLYEDTENQRLTMAGVTLADFLVMSPIHRPLIVSGGKFEQARQSLRTRFSYLEPHELKSFVASQDVEKQPITAIDVRSLQTLDTLTDAEIAEILFLMHMKRGMPSPFLKSVQNEIAYFSEKNGAHSFLYLRHWEQLDQLVAKLLRHKLVIESRLSHIEPVIPEVVRKLRVLLPSGVLIDLDKISRSIFSRQLTLPIYVAGRYEDMEVLSEDFDAGKESIVKRGALIYRKKNWIFEVE